ncbi:hypothetical protein HBI25_143760 [Parastagonospora nodorum]|nr:hypothetical protein HBH53_007130 [Parastagonospora nodorum]KAH3976888.1 hypothetical protein HBH51_074380 [Parastagonospora nodorum]KAH4007706.1 hypothetical protein HBI10_002250 [Parastagonospora nodorum]KAH4016591.1 hypothetical protein HBI13_150260 [Parastagonospora nodorum]KAH4058615.1 hypothetical protein HBH49_035450 [Parastagonospora nodorum]
MFYESKIVTRPAQRRQDSTGSSTAWWKEEMPSSSARNDTAAARVLGDANLDLDMGNVRLPLSEDYFEEDDPTERDSLLTQDQSPISKDMSSSITPVRIVDPYAPKFMARYIYPSERRPEALSPPKPSPPSPAPSSNELNLSYWPNITYLIMSFTKSLINFVMEDNTPRVIEYSALEVRQKMKDIQVQARVAEAPKSSGATNSAPEKVIGIVALVSMGENQPPQAVSITAKPKRVRQLIKGYGVVNVAEDMYGVQIKEALKSLREAG